jgi:2-methylcitrate dehydratase PrpD
MGITHHLAKEVVQAAFKDIPLTAATRVKHALLDDVGIAFLGYSMAGGPLIEYAKDIGGGRPESTLIGDGSKVSCVTAASVNAQMAYDTNFEETGPGHHAFSPHAQTALAIGQRVGASGQDIIAAIAIGYEINGRFQRALLPYNVVGGTQGKRHIPITVAMTAGKLLGLDAVQLNHAIGIAWYFQPQPSEFNWRNLWWKRLGNPHIGFCHMGIQAALLAQKGFEGPIDIIDKEVFYDLDRLTHSPSPYHYPANELHMKPYMTSRPNHPGIQAALEIVTDEGLDPTEIEEIIYRGPELTSIYPFNNPEPTEYWDAIYSVQWAFAAALLGYQPGRDWYSPQRLQDATIRAIALRVRTEVSSAVADLDPAGTTNVGERPVNEVEIIARGKSFSRWKTGDQTLGSPTTPMSKEQLTKKFTTQVASIVGERQSSDLLSLLFDLEQQANLDKVAVLLGPS